MPLPAGPAGGRERGALFWWWDRALPVLHQAFMTVEQAFEPVEQAILAPVLPFCASAAASFGAVRPFRREIWPKWALNAPRPGSWTERATNRPPSAVIGPRRHPNDSGAGPLVLQ